MINRLKRKLVIQKEQVVLNVGAASSRELNDSGWNPPLFKTLCITTWTFDISVKRNSKLLINPHSRTWFESFPSTL
jgi:hypothetical protein